MSARKTFFLVVAVAGAIAMAGSFAKDAIVRRLLVRTLKEASGFDVSIATLHLGLLTPTLELTGVKVLNPTNFPIREAVEINRLFIRYDRAALFGRRGHVPEIDVDFAKVVMIRSAGGEVNLERLAAVESRQSVLPTGMRTPSVAPPTNMGDAEKISPEGSVPPRAASRREFTMPPISIGRLRVKLDALDYYDYSMGSEPMVIPAKMNFDQTFQNVTNLMDIAEQLGGQLSIGDFMGGANGVKAQRHSERKKADHAVDEQIENVIRGL